jgi:hypothetical protein
MKSWSLRRRLLLALIACLVFISAIVYKTASKEGNFNAFDEGMRALTPAQTQRVERLVSAAVSGMVHNEEAGIVYYGEPTPRSNRVFLLWLVAEAGTEEGRRLHDSAGAATSGSAFGAVLYVTPALSLLHGPYGMLLSALFRAEGLQQIIRGDCYVCDERSGIWSWKGELPKDVIQTLLRDQDVKAIRGGSYNLVRVSRKEPG